MDWVLLNINWICVANKFAPSALNWRYLLVWFKKSGVWVKTESLVLKPTTEDVEKAEFWKWIHSVVVAASVVYLYVNSYVFAAVFIVDVGHMTSSGEPGSGGESSTLDSRSTPGCSVAAAAGVFRCCCRWCFVATAMVAQTLLVLLRLRLSTFTRRIRSWSDPTCFSSFCLSTRITPSRRLLGHERVSGVTSLCVCVWVWERQRERESAFWGASFCHH